MKASFNIDVTGTTSFTGKVAKPKAPKHGYHGGSYTWGCNNSDSQVKRMNNNKG